MYQHEREMLDDLSRSDAIRTLLWMGLAAAYEERKRNGRKEG